MTEEDIQIIKDIIDIENNIDDLLKIKAYITKKEYELKEYQDKNNYDILILDLRKFMDENLPPSNSRFNRYSMYRAIKKLKGKKEVDVADTVGIGRKKLLTQRNIGNYTVNKYEKALNNYGYSVDIELTEEQKYMVKAYKLNKSRY